VYWIWEPRLTTTALALVIYGGYFIVRGLIEDPERRARVASVIGIAGTLYIPVNYMSVYWWRSIHQTPTVKLLGGTELSADPRMLTALFVMLGAFSLLYFFLLRVRAKLAARVEAREEREFEREATGSLSLKEASR
jgi:heme exporter protein C